MKNRSTKSAKKAGKPAIASHRGQVKLHAWTKVELETLNPLLQRQMVTGTNVMLARILLKKGCLVPLHSHHNEQLSYVIEGALRFEVKGKDVIVNTGEVLAIPPNVPHLAEALRDTVTLDVFHPPRMDWLNKEDAYLRK